MRLLASVQMPSEGPGKCLCNETNMCDRYSCILPDFSRKSHRKQCKGIKIVRMLNLIVQNGVGLQNQTSFPLTALTSTKAQTKCSSPGRFCSVTLCKQTSARLKDFQVQTAREFHDLNMVSLFEHCFHHGNFSV